MFGFSLAFESPPFRLSPALQLTFAGATALDPRITFTNASAGAIPTYFGSDGLLKTMGYNQFPNSTMQGAVVGVIGSGGAIPTGWQWNAVAGMTREVVAVGYINGVPYIDCRLSGTNTSGAIGYPDIYPQTPSTAAVAAQGQTWVTSLNAYVIAGSSSGFVSATPTFALYYGTSGGTFVEASSGAPVTSTNQRLTASKTAAGATIGRVTSYVGLSLNNGSTVDITVRLYAPQLETGSVANTFSPTINAANVGPRFDYDPASPAGVTGGNLWSAATLFSAGTVTASGPDVVFSGAAALVSAGQAIPSGNGKTFTVTFTITDYVSGDARFILYGSGAQLVGVTRSAAGTYTETVRLTTAGGSFTDQIRIQTVNGATLRVSNISVQEVTFNPRGLLIEESRQNLLLQSRDMTQAAWAKTDVTAARTQVGIDGVANTACLMTEGSATTAATVQSATVAAGSTITVSIVLKRGNTDWVRLTAGGPSLTNGADAWFNLNTGAKGSVAARGTGTSNSSTITSLGGGWYRCAVTTLPDGAYTSATMQIASASADASTSRVANSTYIVDCAQLEVGAFATSIIPTTTTALTRAADVATISGANFSSWWNATQGTLVVEFDRPAISAVGLGYNQVIAGATSASGMAADFIGVVCGAGTPAAQRFDLISASVSQASLTYANGTAVTVYKAVGTWIVNDAVGAQNGTLTSPDTALTVPTVDRFFIGHNSGSAQGVSHIRSLRYYNTRLPNAQLQALTA